MPLLSTHTFKHFTLKTSSISILIITFLRPTLAVADQQEKQAMQWGLGVAAISQQNPYKGIDRNNIIFPFPFFENEYVRFFGPGVDLKLPSYNISESQSIDFSLTGQFDFNGYDKDDIKDTAILNGMRERKGSIMAGGKAQWHHNVVDVNAEWVADVSGRSKGQRFSLGLEKTWFFGKHFMLTPQVSAIWLDTDYVDYYYGVRNNEIRVGRAAYKGNTALNLEFGTRGVYMFNHKQSIFIDAKVTSLANEIKDSPLVDRSTQDFIMFGYMYNF